MVHLSELIFKICNYTIAALLTVLSLTRFCYGKNMYYISVCLSVFYLFFAAILILTEFIEYCKYLFNFQSTVKRKGFFLLFVSILCFDVETKIGQGWNKFSMSVGIITCIYSISLIVIGFFFKKLIPFDKKKY